MLHECLKLPYQRHFRVLHLQDLASVIVLAHLEFPLTELGFVQLAITAVALAVEALVVCIVSLGGS